MPSPTFIRFFQYSLIPLFRLIELFVVREKNVRLARADIRDDRRYVLASNHRGYLDPFLLCYGLRFGIHLRLGPYRFLLKNSFLDNWFLRRLLLAFGCFPVRKHETLPFGMRFALSRIEEGETVMIFPEGRISRSDREYRPRSGVSLLAREDRVMIIPARVDRNRSNGIFRTYRLAVGAPVDAGDLSPEQIMDLIYQLEFSSTAGS